MERPHRRPDRAARLQGAFTLLEVIISMAVFSIVAGGLFGVVQASLRAADELETTQREARRTAAFIELCRKTLATLPPQATLRGDWAEDANPPVQELEFRNAPLIFSWGGTALNYGFTTIGIRAQEDGKFSLAISRSDFAPPDEAATGMPTQSDSTLEPDEQGRYWLVLVPDLEWVQWRFFDSHINDWADMWQSTSRPQLIELEFLLPGDTVPVRSVFPVASAQTVK